MLLIAATFALGATVLAVVALFRNVEDFDASEAAESE